MPDQTQMTDVFDMMLTIYQELADLQVCYQKIYLLRLFLYLGIFPENKKLYQLVMQQKYLHNHDTDLLLQQGLQYCWTTDVNYS